jgi:uncharacterized membrane protein YhaH (DUF805 family)
VDFRKLVSFDGRVGRGQYWLWTIVAVVVYVIGFLLFNAGSIGVIIGIVLIIAGLVVSLATQIKRWHDRDKSGWWIFIALVPFIGGIWALIETGFLAGSPGDNRFGVADSGSPSGG